MAANLTRFEVVIPSVDTGSPADTAITNFRHSMETLTRLKLFTSYVYDVNDNLSEESTLYGWITVAQQATALGYLNTLNAALGKNVDCTIWTVTSEP